MSFGVFYKNLSCDIFEIEGGPMKIGTSVVEEVTVYKIQIDGRGAIRSMTSISWKWRTLFLLEPWMGQIIRYGQKRFSNFQTEHT